MLTYFNLQKRTFRCPANAQGRAPKIKGSKRSFLPLLSGPQLGGRWVAFWSATFLVSRKRGKRLENVGNPNHPKPHSESDMFVVFWNPMSIHFSIFLSIFGWCSAVRRGNRDYPDPRPTPSTWGGFVGEFSGVFSSDVHPVVSDVSKMIRSFEEYQWMTSQAHLLETERRATLELRSPSRAGCELPGLARLYSQMLLNTSRT